MIKPTEASSKPVVEFDRRSENDCFWTLVMSNPDGHFTEDNSEYLHWMVGNIPSIPNPSNGERNAESHDVDITSIGSTICPYLQPFPPSGTGFHRFVFILYQHVSKYPTATNISKHNLFNVIAL